MPRSKKNRTTPPGLTSEEYGRIGAEKRWGPPRTARLDDLTADQRRLILAMIDAAKAEIRAENADRP